LTSLDLSETEITALFGNDRRQVERANDGLLSFFTGAPACRAQIKELRVLRPTVILSAPVRG
jgi:hypothetical protein